MPSSPKAIQILTTVEYLGEYQVSNGAGGYAPAKFFGVVLQAGLGDSPDGNVVVDGTMANLFQPWMWWTPGSAAPNPPATASDPLAVSPPLIEIVKLSSSAATTAKVTTKIFSVSGSVDRSITDQLSSDCTAAIPDNLDWTDSKKGPTSRGDGRTAYPWPAYLAQVARYPCPIPHLLNLCFFLQVLDNGTLPAPGDTLLATVAFTTSVNGAPVTISPKVDQRTITADGRLQIPTTNNSVYITTSVSTVPSTGLAAACTVIPPAPELTAETTNWQVHLPVGSGEVFDLSARLVNSVRRACDATPSPAVPDVDSVLKQAVADSFSVYSLAVLTAQREIIAYGCQPGPSGKSLLDRLLDQWVDKSKGDRDFASRFSSAVQSQRAADQQDTVSANRQWITLLQSNANFLNNALIQTPATPNLAGPPPAPYNNQTNYKKGDLVLYNSCRFQAAQDAKQQVPADNPEYWTQIISPGGINPRNLSDRLLVIEHLQLQLTQASILIQLLIGQWQAVFDAAVKASPPSAIKPSDAAFLKSFLNSSSTTMADLDVRGLLLQCNLGPSWGAISLDLSSRDNARSNFSKQFASRITNLFNLLPGVPSSTILSSPFNDWLGPWVTNRLTTLIPYPLNASAAPAPPAHTDNPQATRGAEGLSVLISSQNVAAQDQTDPLRGVGGVCVLMRQKDASNPWRCLNAGIAMAGLAAGRPALTGRNDPLLIPVPIHEQDGLRSATLTYNNQPLMSSSPAHGFSTGLVPQPSGSPARLISFAHPSVTQGLDSPVLQQWKIPGLAFNKSYDFLLGWVANSGALPPEFADKDGGPGVFSFTGVNSTQSGSPLLPPTIPAVPYRRTVPVSDLRFYSSGASKKVGAKAMGSIDQLALPAIPDDVQPRASEVFPSTTVKYARNTQPGKPSTPLVLLSSYANPMATAFTLSVRKPTTDFLTWDRTQAALDSAAASTRTARINAWQLFHTFARQQTSKFDLSLEDPALGSLSIGVSAVWPQQLTPKEISIQSGNESLTWDDAGINDPNPPDPQHPVTSIQKPTPSLDIVMNASQSASAPTVVKSGPHAWTITLPPGSIANIQLTPKPKANMDQMFAYDILKPPVPYTILAETAIADLPQLNDLYKAFSVLPSLALSRLPNDEEAGFRDPAINAVDFRLAAPSAAPQWLQVSRVDLESQTWRWDGRPSHQLPFKDLAVLGYSNPDPTAQPNQSATDALLAWELEAFATRDPRDSTVRPMQRVSSSHANPSFYVHDDRSTELGASYYRAGVTVYNRYGSLVPPSARSTSSLNEFAQVPGIDGNWTRRFIPARVSADASIPVGYAPPKPAIKYIVPLTGASTVSQPAASSVLVVVQGPWYAIAGLAEDMKAYIDQSDAPVLASDPPQVYEAGADPILFAGKKTSLPTQFKDYGSIFTSGVSNALFHGPVGHTFDPSDANPLWVTSSFVLDPPPSNKVPAQEGTFARVRFSRLIHQEGVVVQAAPAKGSKLASNGPQQRLLAPASSDFESQLTDPVWIQFLPSRFLPVQEPFDTLTLLYNGNNKNVSVVSGSNSAISLTLNPLTAGALDSSHLVFGLLLTEQVPDLLGRGNQERFIDLLLIKSSPAGGKTSASWSYTKPQDLPETDLMGRIVLIQRQVNTSYGCGTTGEPPCDVANAKELFEELFPPPPTAGSSAQMPSVDAMARIIAVSPPIPPSDSSTSYLNCAVDSLLNKGISNAP